MPPARYLRQRLPAAQITLIEPQAVYTARPLSNRLLAGGFEPNDLACDNAALQRDGVRIVRSSVRCIDAGRRQVRLTDGVTVPYERLVVAPGIEFAAERLRGARRCAGTPNTCYSWSAPPN